MTTSVITHEEYNQLMQLIGIHKTSKLFNSLTLEMQVLIGILKGISADEVINKEEAVKLKEWMEEHSDLKGNYPFNQIFNALENILEDGVVSPEEEQELLALFHEFINPKVENHSEVIDFKGKICCLTGTFTNGVKSEIEQNIIRKGGSCIPSLNKSVNYLVVGGEGSTNWAYGNFGGKIKKALEMQSKGIAIEIISELSL